MANPRILRKAASTVRKIAPQALDDIPEDWASVRYLGTIEPHPDYPTLPIIKWLAASALGIGSDTAWVQMTTVDETGATVLMTDDDGSTILTQVPVP